MTYRKLLTAGLVLSAILSTSNGTRAADAYGIAHEKTVEFAGTVVDIACTLTGDCPANCGGGKRQLGFVTADGKLRAAVKSATNFAGAVQDLLPYCGKQVLVDGLLVENPALTLLHVQNLRETIDQKWQPTEAFEKQWVAKNGPADDWFRADTTIKAAIDADGVYGIKGLQPPAPTPK
jgi:hypothetical protein